MPDKKLTDSEIVKALECCRYEYDTKCELCYYNFYSRTGCRGELRRNALDLINHLQAENSNLTSDLTSLQVENEELVNNSYKLKAEVERLQTVKKHIDTVIHRDREYTSTESYNEAFQKALARLYDNTNAKAEAYKEFSEMAIDRVEKARQKYQRLCKEQGEEMDEAMNIHFNGMINLLKELVGEENAD